MKGEITISIDDRISIYVKASNLQGDMEGTIERENWDELLNKEIEIETCRSITIKSYDITDDQVLKVNMKLRKDTGIYHFDLEMKNDGENKYSSKLGGPDLFTYKSILLSPFSMIYNKLKN
ncbi:hypothetical protein VKS41_009366 [Umbelopsis sp. WA50703]